jgi:phosphatidylglycerophosphatase A
MPYAPGTFGSALGLLLIIVLKPDTITLSMIFLPLFVLGLFVSHEAEKVLGKDSGHIVIDEFCGYLLSVVFVPTGSGYLLAAFILFRFFDVIKPPPIRNVEQNIAGGAGIMLDDIVAAVYTNICIQLWRLLF